MSLFHRKPQGAPNGTPTSSQRQNPSSGKPMPGTRGVPHSRQAEHAPELPRIVDANFCYEDDQQS